MKKKKKKKAPKEGAEDDEFAAKLKELEIKEAEDGADATTGADLNGDMDAGTGIWSHDEDKPINYSLLLNRFFSQLAQKNPDHTLSGAKSYKIPPPQCMREGNRKTIFANIADICKRMKRSEEHLTAYLFAELGTSGSVDGSRRLIIKGRFQQAHIESQLRKYISTLLCLSETRLHYANLALLQSNTSHARPANLPTPSSARVRTVCTSSPATTAARAVPSAPSRPVSPPRLARERRCRVNRKRSPVLRRCGQYLLYSCTKEMRHALCFLATLMFLLSCVPVGECYPSSLLYFYSSGH